MAVIRDYTCADLLAKAREIARERRHGYVGIAHLFLAALKLPDSFTKEWARGASLSDFVLSAELCEQMPVWRLGDPREPVVTAKAAALVERLGPAAGEKSVVGWILDDDLNDASLHLLRRGIDASRYLDPDRGRDAAVVGAADARSFEHLGRLNDFCRNLTLLAMSGALHPVVGREAEIQKMRRILLQTMKNAPVLVGEAGVGKTAVVEGFARHLLERETHPVLKRLVVLELNLTSLMSGTKYVGEMEKRIQLILRTVEDDPNVVLFIDELHRIVGMGRTEGGSNDISNMLKPALARGGFRLIGATTFREYQASIAVDKALDRRFETIAVREPDEESAFLMVRDGAAGVFRNHYGIAIDESLIRPTVTLARTYMPLRRLPDSAVSILDRACATCVLAGGTALALPDLERTVSEMADISLIHLQSDAAERYRAMMASLRRSVAGQDRVIATLQSAISAVMLRLVDRERPLGVFLFIGPTGVGKTFVARTLAETLFGSREKFLQLDMGAYKNAEDLSRLLGSAPGYVGHERGGELTNFIKANPNAVVLFDEIEKANPRVFDALLGLFESGYLRDARGEEYDGKNVLFVLSSNVAVKEFVIPGVGRRTEAAVPSPEAEKHKLRAALEAAGFRREFVNRVDVIARFDELDREALGTIAEREIARAAAGLAERGVSLAVDPACREWIVAAAEEEKLGARPIKRLVRDYITKPASFLVMDEGCRRVHVRKGAGDGESIQAAAEDER